jgi:hypothetical protein
MVSVRITTPWSTVLQKQIAVQLVKKFPTSYASQRFIKIFTTFCHCTLSKPDEDHLYSPFL